MFSRIIVILLYASQGLSYQFYDGCNPLACLYYFNDVFTFISHEDTCIKFKKLEGCVTSCSFTGDDQYDIIERLRSVKHKICHDGIDRNLGIYSRESCLERRKFQLLSCTYETWNMQTLDNDSNLPLCRKIVEVQFCPSRVLAQCKEDTKSYVEELFVHYFKPLQTKFCSYYSIGEVWDLKMSKRDLGYDEVSKCFDIHHEQILSCLPQKWTTNIIMTRHAKIELCEAFDVFLQCVNKTVVEHCNPKVAPSFAGIAERSRLAFLPYCVSQVSANQGYVESPAPRPGIVAAHLSEAAKLSDLHEAAKLSDLHEADKLSDLHEADKLSDLDEADKLKENRTHLPSEIIVIHYWLMGNSALFVAPSSYMLLFVMFLGSIM